MSKPEACDAAILKAMAVDPAAEDAVESMMRAQEKFNSHMEDQMDWVAMESEIPAPGSADWDALKPKPGRLDPREIPEGQTLSPTISNLIQKASDLGWTGWDEFKQMRVALMLSNPMTHVKNFIATGGQAAVVRPLEEAMGVVFSKFRKNPAERQKFTELWHYGSGMLRGAQDGLSVAWSLGKTMKKGAFDTNDVRTALREAGYSEELATGKPDIMIENSAGLAPDANAENIAIHGAKVVMNAMYGSQFSALQGVDTMFKMISHRAKVHQLLSREGVRYGIVPGEGLDEYIAKNWKEMSQRVKKGLEIEDELYDLESVGIKQAAEDTFTETPQTQLGKFMSGKYDTSVWWQKAIHESMQVVAPFRSIYTNLMRQSLSRRLLPFFSRETMAELTGKMGKDAQHLAMGRVAGAWTLFGATSALIAAGGIKLHGPDEMDPAVRQMQFELYGKVGGTIQIGDEYFPIDMLPPSLAFPLIYAAAALDGVEEHNYRYSGEEDIEATFLAGFAPFVAAMGDGAWVSEYGGFITKMSGYIQYGNVEGMGTYLASLTTSPMKPPKWYQEVRGYDMNVRTSDGFLNKIKSEWMQDTEAYGLKRNMFGYQIPPIMRHGDNSEYPWLGADTDINNFLKVVQYDRVYPTNISKKILGDGDDYNKVRKGADAVVMDHNARDRFEYYIGQSTITGKTFQEEVRDIMHIPGVYDFERGVLTADPIAVQAELRKAHARRRKVARELVQYHPDFGIREQQIEKFYEISIQNGENPQVAEAERKRKYQEMNQIRLQLKPYF